MDNVIELDKEKKYVKIFSWILIIGSAMLLLKSLLFVSGYTRMMELHDITKNFNPHVTVNFGLYLILNTIKLLLGVIIFIAAVFVLNYKDLWRKILIAGLIMSIIFLFVAPVIRYFALPFPDMIAAKGMEKIMFSSVKTSMLIWSYFWSIAIMVFFIYVIKIFSTNKMKELFKSH